MNPTVQHIITHSRFYGSYDVSTPDKQHLFHVVNSTFRPGKPDLTFHKGPDANNPIAGVCKYRHFSSDCELGLGSPDHPSKMSWTHIHKRSSKREYWFSMNMENGKQKTFAWKRSHPIGGGQWNHKLVEESTKNVVAIFSYSGVIQRIVKMDIFPDFGPQFNLMVLLSGLAVIEQVRRSKTSNGGAAAGGGPGAGGGGC